VTFRIPGYSPVLPRLPFHKVNTDTQTQLFVDTNCPVLTKETSTYLAVMNKNKIDDQYRYGFISNDLLVRLSTVGFGVVETISVVGGISRLREIYSFELGCYLSSKLFDLSFAVFSLKREGDDNELK
jgi:hypothetical protein